MDKLPKACKDCAEYGSHFCDDCLDEISKDFNEPDRIVLSKALKNIARFLHENLESKDSKNFKD